MEMTLCPTVEFLLLFFVASMPVEHACAFAANAAHSDCHFLDCNSTMVLYNHSQLSQTDDTL